MKTSLKAVGNSYEITTKVRRMYLRESWLTYHLTVKEEMTTIEDGLTEDEAARVIQAMFR